MTQNSAIEGSDSQACCSERLPEPAEQLVQTCRASDDRPRSRSARRCSSTGSPGNRTRCERTRGRANFLFSTSASARPSEVGTVSATTVHKMLFFSAIQNTRFDVNSVDVVVEPDESLGRRNAVPFEQAQPRRIDHRIDDHDSEDEERGRQEEPPPKARRSSELGGGNRFPGIAAHPIFDLWQCRARRAGTSRPGAARSIRNRASSRRRRLPGSAWPRPPASSCRAGRNSAPRNRPRRPPAAAPGRSADRGRPRLAASSPTAPDWAVSALGITPLTALGPPMLPILAAAMSGRTTKVANSRAASCTSGCGLRGDLQLLLESGDAPRALIARQPRTCRRCSGRCSRASDAMTSIDDTSNTIAALPA